MVEMVKAAVRLIALGLALAGGEAHAQRLSEEAMQAMRQACRDDARSFCRDVQPGGGRIIICLKQNYSAISPDCREAISDANPRGRRR
jgi:hypothetical protein